MGLRNDKSNVTVDNGLSEQDGLEAAVDEKRGTVDDRADMFRLGKTQELRVCLSRFRLASRTLMKDVNRGISDSYPFSASP